MIRRKRLAVLAALLSLLLLVGCGQVRSSVYDVEYGGGTYTVDKENQTITYDGATIQVEMLSGSGGGYEVTFTYPDGSTYWWDQSSSGMGAGGWSDDYDSERYVDGWTLIGVVDKAWSNQGGGGGASGSVLAGLLLILFGAVGVVEPKAIWYLNSGWRYKDAEPSDLALLVHRFGGGVAAVVGLILLFA